MSLNDDSHPWWQADLMTEQKWRREERAQFKARNRLSEGRFRREDHLHGGA